MDQQNTSSMSFINHLEELRYRIIRCLIALVIAAAAAYAVEPYVLTFLIRTIFEGSADSLALINPVEGFTVKLKLSLIMGLIVSSPVIFWQFWGFVSPGLYRREKNIILPIVVFSTLSFLVGALFAFHILPYATRFFQSFATEGIQNTWSLSKYVDFIGRLIIAFGIVFELPLVIFFLARLGLVTPQFLWSKMRYAIVIFLALAAMITPPDLFTQVVLALPLVVLYMFSILLAMIAVKRSEKKKAAP
jgi:sec-independent protein translocase protein TatC